MFKKKCKVQPTWSNAAAGGKMSANITKRLSKNI